MVSINGKPCGDLTYAEVIVLMESLTDVLQMLIKRYRNAQNTLVQFCSAYHIENVGVECNYFADIQCELLIVLLFVSLILFVCTEKRGRTVYLKELMYRIQMAQFRHRRVEFPNITVVFLINNIWYLKGVHYHICTLQSLEFNYSFHSFEVVKCCHSPQIGK